MIKIIKIPSVLSSISHLLFLIFSKSLKFSIYTTTSRFQLIVERPNKAKKYFTASDWSNGVILENYGAKDFCDPQGLVLFVLDNLWSRSMPILGSLKFRYSSAMMRLLLLNFHFCTNTSAFPTSPNNHTCFCLKYSFLLNLRFKSYNFHDKIYATVL